MSILNQIKNLNFPALFSVLRRLVNLPFRQYVQFVVFFVRGILCQVAKFIYNSLIPYFIEYSAHFFTWKMMLKYSMRTIHGR